MPSLLDAAGGAKPLLAGRGHPLLATLAGAGLRIEEALTLERRRLNLAKGTLAVVDSKTVAGVRVVDLTPALREELALWLDRPFQAAERPRLPDPEGAKGQPPERPPAAAARGCRARERETRSARHRADREHQRAARAPAHLRFAPAAAGDDVAYTAEQLGHTDPAFSLRVYNHAVKRRQRPAGAELEQFNRAIEWARWAQAGTNGASAFAGPLAAPAFAQTKTPR